MSTYTDLITAALTEIRVARAGDVIPAEDAALGLYRAGLILGSWNITPEARYDIAHAAFTLTPGLDPHTIGLAANTPTWTITTNRPDALVGATIIRSGIRYPVTLHDEEWWRNRVLSTFAGPAYDGWYDASWPNGELHLYPTPTAADTIELAYRVPLPAIDLTADVVLPEGYERALMLTLAEELAPAFGVQASPATSASAREARAAVFNANTTVPNLVTRDAGMPGSGGCAGANIPRFLRGY